MKILISLFMIILSFKTMAFGAPTQNIVDQYVQLAQKLDKETIQGKKSKWSCHFPVVNDSSLIAWGKTMDEATQRLQLLCIKDQCLNLGKKVTNAIEELLNISESDYRDLLESTGRSPEEIEEAVLALKNYSPASTQPLTCDNSASFRSVAFDNCFSVPVECAETKFSLFNF